MLADIAAPVADLLPERMLQQGPGVYLWLGQGRADPGPDGESALAA